MMQPDANYSINPWMRPEERLGDTDETMPPLALDAGPLLGELLAESPLPLPAAIPPRFGYPQGEPGIVEVLSVPPRAGLRDTPTRQESGQPGTQGPSLNSW